MFVLSPFALGLDFLCPLRYPLSCQGEAGGLSNKSSCPAVVDSYSNMKFSLTKKQVQDILNAHKYIDSEHLWEQTKRKNIPVYICEESREKDIGLVFTIWSSKGVALKFRNERVRGINRRERHVDRSGNIVRGWHLHEPEKGDVVEPVRRDFADFDDLVDYARQKWNIMKRGSFPLTLWNNRRRS